MKKENGFSVVELLVTLFVAAAFLLAGYQLYAMIIKDGGETKQQAKASNAAYDYLQQYKATAKLKLVVDCVPIELLPIESKTISGLSNVKVKVSMTCPYLNGANPLKTIAKVEVILTYGNDNPQKQVIQATYVNK